MMEGGRGCNARLAPRLLSITKLKSSAQEMDGSAHISGVFSEHLLSLIDVNTAMGQAASQNQSMPHREYI